MPMFNSKLLVYQRVKTWSGGSVWEEPWEKAMGKANEWPKWWWFIWYPIFISTFAPTMLQATNARRASARPVSCRIRGLGCSRLLSGMARVAWEVLGGPGSQGPGWPGWPHHKYEAKLRHRWIHVVFQYGLPRFAFDMCQFGMFSRIVWQEQVPTWELERLNRVQTSVTQC